MISLIAALALTATPVRCSQEQFQKTPIRCACFERSSMQYRDCVRTKQKRCDSKRAQTELDCRREQR